MPRNICIIPARGGSKRIPRKNIRNFLGRPIISYSIEMALRTGLFSEVMVSTDDLEIAEIARSYGARVPFLRSSENSNDYATTWDVLEEVLGEYKTKMNIEFSHVCCIYPTAPLIQEGHLNDGYNKLLSGDVSLVYPVVPFSYPVWRGLDIKDDGSVRMIWPENLNVRTQDLSTVVHDAGQWYWIKKDYLNKEATGIVKSIVLSELDVQDIDNEVDWKLAELKFQLKAMNF